ncbi:MAG: bifunctional N-acetylglucosamine-1-phosphate uridyltransferase/glucosamine-1-phosphate acetyltransferase [Planctomycetes bacterium]|nr:bifunctional N-acetylglucosamine-1-phosphate uridyltransferase/glucosamine-1-phosphate acetyltransferase [Planctomycetota bacterium]
MARALDILILAAGRGTRMKSDLPKVLHPLHGEPLIAHVLAEARALAPDRIGVIVGHGRELVRAAVAAPDLEFVVQKEQKGTGHAIRCASRSFAAGDGDVIVLSGDVPLMRAETLRAFVAAHRRSRALASVMTAELAEPGSLGRIIRDAGGRIERIVEAREASPEERAIREINSGIYVFRKSELFARLKGLKRQAASGEYYLTDVIKDLAAAGLPVQAFRLEDETEAFGINTLDDLATAQEALRRRIWQDCAAAGVEIVDPSSTFIGKGVRIGAGTVVWPFSVLMPGVSIGARCRVGPFAHLRSGTLLEDGAEVGNFVEVKNSRLGAKTLARHLSYIGDATIGRDVNVGAGVITANYDGRDKHRTEIDDGAFVGSGAILVAPVSVGREAMIGAGAVVTSRHDVAAGETVVGVPARPFAGKAKKKNKAPARTRRR